MCTVKKKRTVAVLPRAVIIPGILLMAGWFFYAGLGSGWGGYFRKNMPGPAGSGLEQDYLVLLALLAAGGGAAAVSRARSLRGILRKIYNGAKCARAIPETGAATAACRDELLISEERYRSLFTSMPEGFCVMEMVFDAAGAPADYRFLEVNPAFEEQTGLRNAKGRLMRELAPDHEAHWFETYGRIALTGEPARFVHESKATDRWHEVSAFRLGGPESRKVAALFSDISERRRAEEKARTLAGIVAASSDAIISEDLAGTILSWNKGAEEIYGYSSEEAVGKKVSILLAPGRSDEVPDILKRTAFGEKPGHFETVRARKDGQTVQVSMAVSPLLGHNDSVIGASTIARDITESKRLEEALKRSNENWEQFAYVASHDLQEPLRMMASYSELLERRYKDKLDTDANEFIAYIVDGAKRLQKLINDLLAYSRIGRAGPEAEVALDCNTILGRVLRGMKRLMEDSGAIVTNDRLPELAGRETDFMQLFQNLIGNALKFRGAEPPRVHIGAERKGACWLFSVKDNGIGIEPQYKDRVFIIFQRLHGRGEYPGTGIGLSICKKIVEQHGGKIWLESQPGKGATFYFTIPAGSGG